MRIRTRHRLFKVLVALAVIVFAGTLYDMFVNDSGWQIYFLLGYGVLLLAALLLYVGRKPVLPDDLVSEVATAAPEPVAPAGQPTEEAAEVRPDPPRRALGHAAMGGPHHFACPFCSHRFGLQATHVRRLADFRLDCPYCGNSIRIPRRPRVTSAPLDDLEAAAPPDRVHFACERCGEVLRLTAPGARSDRPPTVSNCPHCQNATVVLAAAAA